MPLPVNLYNKKEVIEMEAVATMRPIEVRAWDPQLKALQGHIISLAPVEDLLSMKSEVRDKIEVDLIRFRTCCADPRASK